MFPVTLDYHETICGVKKYTLDTERRECPSVSLSPTHFKWATTRMRLRASLHCVSAHWCALWMRGASPTTAQGTSWTPPLAEVCLQSSLWGVSEPETVVQWDVWLCTCGLQIWSHSLSPIPLWHSLPAVDVSLWCPESVLENGLPGHWQRVL